jgi:hypothetical protein
LLTVMFADRGESVRNISARRAMLRQRGDMKRTDQKAEAGRVEKNEILPEYDFSGARPNKYAARYAAGSTVVVIDPDVAAVFQNAGDVNEALRALAGIIHKHRSRRAGPRRSA